MKQILSILLILSLVLPASGTAAVEQQADGCTGCGCAAMSCCPPDAGAPEKGAPANIPAGQLRVNAPDLALQSVAFFLRALDATALEPPPVERLFRLTKQYVSSRIRNCTFLI